MARGQENLPIGHQLYLFAYSGPPGVCIYYFQSLDPVDPEPDGSWKTDLDFTGLNAGDKVVLYAVAVTPDVGATLREVSKYYQAKGESPQLMQLPSETTTAHINLEISS
jgi:hypothetical protein